MKVTFVVPGANLSGGIRIVDEHARMLHACGHKVTVVTPRAPSLMNRISAILRRRPFPRKQKNRTHFDGAPYRVLTLDSYRPVNANDVPDADIIIATFWITAEWVSTMPESKGVKVSFIQHYEAHSNMPKDRVDAVWRLPMRKIVVSRWLEGIARQQFGDDGAIFVPNGVNTSKFRFVERNPNERRIVGGMYSGIERTNFKRFWLALETIYVLKARGVNFQFICFGACEPGKGELPPDSCFEMTPTQERIAEIYAQCDCWLFTSDKEGYGLPLLEAMSSGTPVVATAAGAAPELLKSGGGFLVTSSDPEILADAVQRVISLKVDEWRAMSRLSRAEAERHSWDVIGGQLEAALQLILKEARSE